VNLKFWIFAHETYCTASNKFERATLTRAFSLFFCGLAGLVTFVGLAINFGFHFSPLLLPLFIVVGVVMWIACYLLIDKSAEIKKWIRGNFPSPDSAIKISSNVDTSFHSATLPTEHKPPRSVPRAKS
jgi:hypothetical protein